MRVRFIVLTLIMIVFLPSSIMAEENLDYASIWLNLPQDYRRCLVKGISEGLATAMLALEVAWKIPDSATPNGFWQQGAADFLKAYKSFFFGKHEETIGNQELIARLDAFYLAPGHEKIGLWKAVFLVLAARNVPEWPIKDELR